MGLHGFRVGRRGCIVVSSSQRAGLPACSIVKTPAPLESFRRGCPEPGRRGERGADVRDGLRDRWVVADGWYDERWLVGLALGWVHVLRRRGTDARSHFA
jgi:hypothetical protein